MDLFVLIVRLTLLHVHSGIHSSSCLAPRWLSSLRHGYNSWRSSLQASSSLSSHRCSSSP
ncbi:unnamed protein product [Brassica oleracea var. botrytis]